MKVIAEKIEDTVSGFIPMLRSLNKSVMDHKPSPQKWSRKEILGHLVDSAQNNIQRLIRVQYEVNPKVLYHQDHWVRLAQYQMYDSNDLIQLWHLLNKHLCKVLRNMPAESYAKMCDLGKNEVELVTAKFVAEDYLEHMRHHLRQIVVS